MVGNPQGRDRGMETLQKAYVDQVWVREHYAQVYRDELSKGSCGTIYYNLEASAEAGMDAQVHTYVGDISQEQHSYQLNENSL
jgi:hypothetical protein